MQITPNEWANIHGVSCNWWAVICDIDGLIETTESNIIRGDTSI